MGGTQMAGEAARLDVPGIGWDDTGRAEVSDEARLKEFGAEALARLAALSEDDAERARARRALWQVAEAVGIRSASTEGLYRARATGGWSGFTVPALNLRMLTFDSARAALRAAQSLKSSALIFEIARSEMGYTGQRPQDYGALVVAAAIAEGWRGPLFLQGDHFQVAARRDRLREVAALKDLIDEALEAGFRNIDIDASTVVDLTRATPEEAQAENATLTAELAAHIRQRRRDSGAVPVSIGGEIGEVGKENSTERDLSAFLDGVESLLEDAHRAPGLSKVSVQTGTHHGGVVLPDGRMAQVAVDFSVHKRLSAICRERYGIGGTVQHGASTLPDDLFDRFPDSDAVEIHLATGFQNLVLEHLPAELHAEMDRFVLERFGSERNEGDTEEQFLYRNRKRTAGPFKRRLWDLSIDGRERIGRALEEKCRTVFERLGVRDSDTVVETFSE